MCRFQKELSKLDKKDIRVVKIGRADDEDNSVNYDISLSLDY